MPDTDVWHTTGRVIFIDSPANLENPGVSTTDESNYVEFERILELFERHGWKLQKVWGTYRVFIDPTGEEPLPFLIPVEGKKVHERYYQKVKQFFEETEE